MKLRTLVSALALLSGAAAANAADLYNGGGSGSLKDPAATSQISGFYVEGLAGPGFSQNDVAGVATLSETGGVAVLRAGYDKANLAGRFGVGIYAEGSDNFDVNGKVPLATLKFGEQYGWGAGGKVFYDHGLGQVFGVLGWAETQDNVAGTVKTLDGYLWGAGISLKVFGNVYTKIEFDQIHYGDLTDRVTGVGSFKWSQVDDRLLFGIGYSFPAGN
jgi:opacity protein-like surface antigen